MRKIDICVIGTGHLGRHHTRILSTLPNARLVGIYDIDSARASDVAVEFSTRAFDSLEELLSNCEAAVIASTTGTHREIAEIVLAAGCDVLVEKPIAENSAQGAAMVAAAEKAGKILMVGHIEQFNPAFEVARTAIKNPLFVESHRLTAFRGRGTDVTVVHDLLIHDLELLLAITEDDVVSMDAAAKAILTPFPDIANVRLNFSRGCVANLTASRISLANMRKMRIFQPSAYISIDFGGTVEVAALEGAGPIPPADATRFDLPGGSAILKWEISVPKTDALTAELSHFLECVETGIEPRISGKRGLKALELADRILASSGE